MERRYEHILLEHFGAYRQMVFLSGPRQVGKTTTARAVAQALGEHFYLSWDRQTDRAAILAGRMRWQTGWGCTASARSHPCACWTNSTGMASGRGS